MNRDCYGDFYTVDGHRFYWCFLDSAVVDATNLQSGSRCTNCGRTIQGDECGEVKDRRTRTVIKVLRDGGKWHVHSDTVDRSRR